MRVRISLSVTAILTVSCRAAYPFGADFLLWQTEYELVEIAADWKEVSHERYGKCTQKITFVAQVHVSAPNGKLCKPYQVFMVRRKHLQ